MNDGQFPTTLWLVLFPITYLIHVAEEYWAGGGYPAYLKRVRGIDLSPSRFLKLQAIGLVLILVSMALAVWFRFPEFAIATFSGLLIANGISHSVTAVADGGYGPGLITSAMLWLPLGVLSLYSLLGRMPHGRLALAAVIGMSVQVGVAVIALFSGKKTGKHQ